MDGAGFRLSEPGLAEFTTGLTTFVTRSPALLSAAKRSLAEQLSLLEQRKRSAQALQEQQRDRLSHADDALSRCLAGVDNDCQELYDLVDRRRAALGRANQRLANVTDHLRRVKTSAGLADDAARAMTAMLDSRGMRAISLCHDIQRDLAQASAQIARFVAESTGQSGRSATGQASAVASASGRPASASTARGHLPQGFAFADLANVPASEYADIDHQSFAKMPESEMREAISLLTTGMLGKVDSGASREEFRLLDQQQGRNGSVTLLKTYDLFFGSDAIVLSHRNGQYSVTNGRHRIWLARQMGITHLPARVI